MLCTVSMIFPRAFRTRQLIHVQGNHDLFQILHGLERILEAGDGRHASKAEKERVVIQEAGHIAF